MVWLERELRRKQLQLTQTKVKSISLTDSESTTNSTSGLSESTKFQKLLIHDQTVSSLQKTIKDLQIQR